MRVISKYLPQWPNILLLFTLLSGLLPPAQLAAASAPESHIDGKPTLPSIRWPRPETGIEPVPAVSQTDEPEAVGLTQQRATGSPVQTSQTFALPFEFKQAAEPTSELPSLPAGPQLAENEGSALASASNFGQLPLSFVPNAGQLDPSVHFQAHGLLGSQLFFAPNEVVLALPAGTLPLKDKAPFASPRPVPSPSVDLHLRFEGANPRPNITGGERLPGVINYFIGNDPTQWQTNLPTYAELIYHNLYPGIDLYYNGTAGALKGTYIVAPGADPTQIRWYYDGAETVHSDEATGNLIITLVDKQKSMDLVTPGSGVDAHQSKIIEQAPIAWQEINGRQVPVPSRYAVTDEGMIGLVVGSYNPDFPLTIDPTLDFSTYLGGNGDDSGAGIAVDSAGNIYVIGTTHSSNFPRFNSLFSNLSGADVFITKIISASGVYTYGYSTYLGGGEDDTGNGIAIDNQGNAYVTGSTLSWSDFPTTTGALKPSSSSDCFDMEIGFSQPCRDAFLVKLNASGSGLLYSTYLGGDKHDAGHDIALDGNKNIYIAGETRPDDDQGPVTTLGFPTVNAIQPTWGGRADAFVTKIISASGVYTYGYSTYLGGTNSDYGYGIAVEGNGNAYVTGQTGADFPTHNELQADQGSTDAFVTKIISASGVYTYGYSTYLGGEFDDYGHGIAVDDSGNAYITGETSSNNFPTRSEVQTDQAGTDAFVTKIISASGIYTYGYSTYLGGTSFDYGYGIAVNDSGDAYVTGNTHSSNFPTTLNALTYTFSGGDVFITKIISASGSYTYSYSTYLGVHVMIVVAI